MLKILRYGLPVFFFLSLIFYFSSLPGDKIPKFSFMNFPYSDKVEHFLIYSFLGFSICRALTWKVRDLPPSRQLYKKAIWLTTILGALYGITDEFHQSFVPGRSVEALDATADMLGSLFGSSLTLLYRRWIPH